MSRRTPQRIDLVLVGTRGQVGSALRRRLALQAPSLRETAGLDLHLVASFDRRGLAWDLAGLDPAAVEARLQPRDETELRALLSHLARADGAPTVVIDCTASDAVADRYAEWLAAGRGVVAANKRANARGLAAWRTLQALSARHGAPYRYETTVGAAIPVIGPLRDLALRGERVQRVTGVLSGSLSYLLERLHAGESFSDALAGAERLGYTEPDPGDDLRADDLARKLLVLAREAGFAIEPDDVHVEPFIASALTEPTRWRERLVDEDAHWRARVAQAHSLGRRWVMLAEVDAAGARIALQALAEDSPFAALPAGQNLVRIETELQRERPLWLGGPGAGPEVTAAGVLSDVIDAARALAASHAQARAWGRAAA